MTRLRDRRCLKLIFCDAVLVLTIDLELPRLARLISWEPTEQPLKLLLVVALREAPHHSAGVVVPRALRVDGRVLPRLVRPPRLEGCESLVMKLSLQSFQGMVVSSPGSFYPSRESIGRLIPIFGRAFRRFVACGSF